MRDTDPFAPTVIAAMAIAALIIGWMIDSVVLVGVGVGAVIVAMVMAADTISRRLR